MTVRQKFFILAPLALVAVALALLFWPPAIWAYVVVAPLVAVGIWDARHGRHNVLRNYPVIGHIRYFAEFIRPEIQQYLIATNQSGRPYPREVRDLVLARALGHDALQPFGTQHDLLSTGEDFALHSLAARPPPLADARVRFGGASCTQPYEASRLNISAMSFGALSSNAILALSTGAKLVGCAHDTGEGGLSDHHLAGGADIVWQIGTGYFGCRSEDGAFDPDRFAERAAHPQVRMIEIKLSQGAKPSHGGILPAAKITPEIARIRGIPMDRDCISPPLHTAFEGPTGLLAFVARLRKLSGGKPVGFKLCIGPRREFLGIVKAMLETGIRPDFITVDGAEGGTGAAPVEFSNRLGTPVNEALPFVYHALIGAGLRDEIRLVASGKVARGFDLLVKVALGADTCNAARAFMFTVGCIQALRCHTNSCPTGVATQDASRARAVIVADKAPMVASYQKATVAMFLDLVGAMGLASVSQLGPRHILRRMDDSTARGYDEIYPAPEPGAFLEGALPEAYARPWHEARADRF